MEPITVTVTTQVGAGEAFERFLELTPWWPSEYTWSGPGSVRSMRIGTGQGALCTEYGPDGYRCDRGRMRDWAPPHRLGFSWQIGPGRQPLPDPATASDVAVRFDDGAVTLTHDGFDRCTDAAAAAGYRDAMAGDRGWPLILDRFADHLGSRARGPGS